MGNIKHVILESPEGRGKVFEEERFICDVEYSLQVTQIMTSFRAGMGPEEWVRGNVSIDGYIEAEPRELHNMMMKRLVLRLKDGRRIEFFVTNSGTGSMRCSGDFF